MTCYSIEPKTRKYIKVYRYLQFARNLSNKFGKKLLDAATKTGLDALNTASKKVFHKAAEATGELMRIKIVDKTVKPKPIIDQNYGNFEEVVIHLRKGKKN